jgi:tetratricopeptide (TPR) repeat protein
MPCSSKSARARRSTAANASRASASGALPRPLSGVWCRLAKISKVWPSEFSVLATEDWAIVQLRSLIAGSDMGLRNASRKGVHAALLAGMVTPAITTVAYPDSAVHHPIESHQPIVRLPFVSQPDVKSAVRQLVLSFGRDTIIPAENSVFSQITPFVMAKQRADGTDDARCIEAAEHSQADRALADLLAGRTDSARTEAGAALSETNKSLHGHLARGWIAFVDARFGEAVNDFALAVSDGPNCPAPYIGMAFARFATDDNVGALKALDTLTSLEPNFWDGRILRGFALERTGRFSDGTADIEAAYGHASRDPFAMQAFADTRRHRRGDPEAIDAYSDLISHFPDSAEALTIRCSLNVDAGRLQDAIADCSQARLLNPKVHGLNESLGLALRGVGDFFGAVTAFNGEIALFPNEAPAYRDRGITFRYLHQFDRAIEDLSSAIQLAPDYTDALVDRSAIYGDVGKFDLCIADANAALAISPDYPQAFLNRGNAEFWLGRYQEALADFGQAIAFRPGLFQAFVSKGDAERALGQFEPAIADYDKALTLQPDDSTALSGKDQALHKIGSMQRGAGSP